MESHYYLDVKILFLYQKTICVAATAQNPCLLNPWENNSTSKELSARPLSVLQPKFLLGQLGSLKRMAHDITTRQYWIKNVDHHFTRTSFENIFKKGNEKLHCCHLCWLLLPVTGAQITFFLYVLREDDIKWGSAHAGIPSERKISAIFQIQG